MLNRMLGTMRKAKWSALLFTGVVHGQILLVDDLGAGGVTTLTPGAMDEHRFGQTGKGVTADVSSGVVKPQIVIPLPKESGNKAISQGGGNKYVVMSAPPASRNDGGIVSYTNTPSPQRKDQGIQPRAFGNGVQGGPNKPASNTLPGAETGAMGRAKLEPQRTATAGPRKMAGNSVPGTEAAPLKFQDYAAILGDLIQRLDKLNGAHPASQGTAGSQAIPQQQTTAGDPGQRRIPVGNNQLQPLQINSPLQQPIPTINPVARPTRMRNTGRRAMRNEDSSSGWAGPYSSKSGIGNNMRARRPRGAPRPVRNNQPIESSQPEREISSTGNDSTYNEPRRIRAGNPSVLLSQFDILRKSQRKEPVPASVITSYLTTTEHSTTTITTVPQSTPTTTTHSPIPSTSDAGQSKSLFTVKTAEPERTSNPTEDFSIPRDISLYAASPTDQADPHKLAEFVADHDGGVMSAGRARKAFLDMRLKDARTQAERAKMKLKNLKGIEKKYFEKLKGIEEEIGRIKSAVTMGKSLLGNAEDRIADLGKNTQSDDAEKRLKEMEVLRLAKLLNKEKSRLEELEQKHKMAEERMKKHKEEKDELLLEVQANESKLKSYGDMADDIKKSLSSISAGISEVKKNMSAEGSIISGLEIAYREPEDDRHLPMFVRFMG